MAASTNAWALKSDTAKSPQELTPHGNFHGWGSERSNKPCNNHSRRLEQILCGVYRDIAIANTVTSVTATNGSNAHSIGAGCNNLGGTVTIGVETLSANGCEDLQTLDCSNNMIYSKQTSWICWRHQSVWWKPCWRNGEKFCANFIFLRMIDFLEN